VKVVELKHGISRWIARGEVSTVAPEGWEMPSDMRVRQTQDSVNGNGRNENEDLEKGALGWARQDYAVDEENPNGGMLSVEELELERRQRHLIGPVGVGSDSGCGSGKGMSSLVGAMSKALQGV
jgi:hypothetical protein